MPETALTGHRQFVHDMMRLQLWYLWHWLKKHPNDDFYYCLRERIEAYRKTEFFHESMAKEKLYQEPGWREKEAKILALYRESPIAEQFEQGAFAVLEGTFDRRAEKDALVRTDFSRFQSGSLRYDPPTNPVFPGAVFVHIANACRPRSIFDDPKYLPQCLLDLMDKAQAEYGIDKLGTSTWLNSHPRWLALFPEEWIGHMGPVDTEVRWSYNFWGQFINAQGSFNEKLGQKMRRTAEFPYWPRYSWCIFGSLRAHLKTLL